VSNALFNPKFGSASVSNVSDSGVANFGSSGLDKYKNSLKTLYNLIIFKLKLSNESVSRKQLILEIDGKIKLSCDLKRHLSPRTVGTIMRSLPLEGNSHLLGKSIVYFETSVDSGIERARSEFKKGDVAFLPSTGSFCFFVGNVESAKTMTPIGKFKDDNDELKNVKPGNVLRLYEETT
jgi:hypothetical protein|tara:strand:+ start:17 stop:553 length:537 start_codon:yes stop_codon:yes gene_type:complete